MTADRAAILNILDKILTPQGGSLVQRDMIRALDIQNGAVRFVIEASAPEEARALADVSAQAEAAIKQLAGVTSVQIVMTAHGPASPPASAAVPKGAPPNLGGAGAGSQSAVKIGQHPTPHQGGPAPIAGIARILAVGSGKGGVGKSTVSSNLAVALARQGRRVGLLDADIYGPSQPRMMGVSQRPASPDGKIIQPLHAHGVTMMSIGLMLKEDEAVIWRGPMLMGALQQLLTQVAWGTLDVLIIDLPPGTGDVQLSLCQRTQLSGAIVVSTPQDVALLDARKALDMFAKLKTPVLGLIENMSTYICPNCGHEAHLFGHGGVAAEALRQDLPFLGELPLSIDVRLAGDAGTPIALGDSPAAKAYGALAQRLIAGGMA
jgi:ATP-binding protein involved in chromosome partitioning